MTFFDFRKPNMNHCYYVYVYPIKGDEKSESNLYRVGTIKELKKRLRDQKRIFDIVKVW